MSAAHKLVTHDQVIIGGTTAAPAARPAARPAPKPKLKLGSILAVGSVWAVFMVLCFSLIQKNAAIRTENGEMARMNAQIAQLEQQNLALEGKIANQVSVAEVDKWAKAHNMKPPTGVVQTLTGKPEAVAVRQSPAPQAAAVQADTESGPSWWEALVARVMGGSSSQAAGAKR